MIKFLNLCTIRHCFTLLQYRREIIRTQMKTKTENHIKGNTTQSIKKSGGYRKGKLEKRTIKSTDWM